MAQVETLWKGEQPDPGWTHAVLSELDADLRNLGSKGWALEAACGQTLCRVVVEFQDPIEASRFSEQAVAPEVRKWIDVMPGERGPAYEVFFAKD